MIHDIIKWSMLLETRPLVFKLIEIFWSHCVGQLLGPLLLTWFNFNPRMDKYYIHYKLWDDMTYPFLDYNGATVEVNKWIRISSHIFIHAEIKV